MVDASVPPARARRRVSRSRPPAWPWAVGLSVGVLTFVVTNDGAWLDSLALAVAASGLTAGAAFLPYIAERSRRPFVVPVVAILMVVILPFLLAYPLAEAIPSRSGMPALVLTTWTVIGIAGYWLIAQVLAPGSSGMGLAIGTAVVSVAIAFAVQLQSLREGVNYEVSIDFVQPNGEGANEARLTDGSDILLFVRFDDQAATLATYEGRSLHLQGPYYFNNYEFALGGSLAGGEWTGGARAPLDVYFRTLRGVLTFGAINNASLGFTLSSCSAPSSRPDACEVE